MKINEWEDPTKIDQLDGGGERRILGYTDDIMLVHYSLEARDEGAPHSHEETTQASFMIEGSLELLGEYSAIVEAGDSYIVPPGVVHGVRAREPCKVIDIFSPPVECYVPD
ncbi:cupin domain-containing protein [Halobacteriales archaeon QH_8_64_26]|nr:MAG: cupin domain-containing protein [Halobacteriales archaeon QH_8_64_26]